MKKIPIVFTLLFLCIFNYSYAQLKFPFPNKDGEWEVAQMDPEGIRTLKCSVEKDTLINSKTYSIIKLRKDLVRCAFRSDSLKVYAKNINDLKGDDSVLANTDEYVLYDFSLKIGDHFKVVNYPEYAWIPNDTVEFEVEDVDSVKIKGEYRRRLQLTGGMNHQYWIEGIGSTISPLYQAFMTEFEVAYMLYCYRENGKNIFGDFCQPDNVQTIKNPFKTSYNAKEKMLTVYAAVNQPLVVEIFDSMGRQVCSSTEHANSQLDLSYLKKGYFIVTLHNGSSSYSHKFVVN